MKNNLEYNLHKIAANNKLLIEVLSSKEVLNKVQHHNFCILFNDTQNLMLTTTIEFLKLNNNFKQLKKITEKPYINDVVKIVEKSLKQLRKEKKARFKKIYINYINADNY